MFLLSCIGKDAAASWYNEVKSYEFKKGGFSMATGHFTQLVWKGSKKLGVGLAKSKSGKTYFVAEYKPPGNYEGEYEKNVATAKC
jgi:hypothetical protein